MGYDDMYDCTAACREYGRQTNVVTGKWHLGLFRPGAYRHWKERFDDFTAIIRLLRRLVVFSKHLIALPSSACVTQLAPLRIGVKLVKHQREGTRRQRHGLCFVVICCWQDAVGRRRFRPCRCPGHDTKLPRPWVTSASSPAGPWASRRTGRGIPRPPRACVARRGPEAQVRTPGVQVWILGLRRGLCCWVVMSNPIGEAFGFGAFSSGPRGR